MKILKHGKYVKYRKFVCENCGCEFVAGHNEYNYDLSFTMAFYKYYTTCPECNQFLCVNEEDAPLYFDATLSTKE